MVAKSAAIHYSQQNTKTQTGEALNKKTKGKHHTKQNNKTLNTLTPHEHNKDTQKVTKASPTPPPFQSTNNHTSEVFIV